MGTGIQIADRQIELVIFDMDGLMFDTERLTCDCLMQAGDELGCPLPYSLLVQTIGLNRVATQQLVLGAMGQGFAFDSVYSRGMQLCDDHVSAHGVPLKPGLMELLSCLEQSGVSKAVASSTDAARVNDYLRRAGVDWYFDVVLSGEMVSRGKPAPDIFLKAGELAGTAPKHSLVLEDSPYGILAASDAGMLPVMVPDLIKPDSKTANLAWMICDSLNDVTMKIQAGSR